MRNITLLLLCLWSSFAMAQTEGQEGKKNIFAKFKENKTVSGILESKKPITTNFKDDVSLDGILQPDFGQDKQYRNLHEMPQAPNGAYQLQPGYYELTNLSYCLKAGTHGPGQGDAYGLAILEGKMEDVVHAVIRRSQEVWRNKEKMDVTQVQDRDNRGNIVETAFRITQRDVQVLLWAIIAKADFQNMQGRTKVVATMLLTPQQLLKLNGGALKTAANFADDKNIVNKPGIIETVERAEASIRALYQNANATYEDFEKLAVLIGLANEPQPVNRGTWFKHKNGYYVSYYPESYSRTLTRVYVPENAGTVSFTATGTVATPSDARQRLAQTDISTTEYQQLGLR
ncbi:hypothetical protein SAMN05444008_11831 [Cnuella takakiae]|uniref:Uncharacterized protein n=1 Tax=Cnuella takakiae TaxID=1302690 RepID=A0A1M5H4M4_9BACT|nr:hypothetical protein [Cnuella takakiae]OLY91114.1 hypothetical protein BUE76_03750 [Cnuella takakiae]SHG10940.1 hypothetical protein SAMN05444008_11831 [Cnuella takakiae]